MFYASSSQMTLSPIALMGDAARANTTKTTTIKG